MEELNLDAVIRKVKDFPKKGILFMISQAFFLNNELING